MNKEKFKVGYNKEPSVENKDMIKVKSKGLLLTRTGVLPKGRININV